MGKPESIQSKAVALVDHLIEEDDVNRGLSDDVYQFSSPGYDALIKMTSTGKYQVLVKPKGEPTYSVVPGLDQFADYPEAFQLLQLTVNEPLEFVKAYKTDWNTNRRTTISLPSIGETIERR